MNRFGISTALAAAVVVAIGTGCGGADDGGGSSSGGGGASRDPGGAGSGGAGSGGSTAGGAAGSGGSSAEPTEPAKKEIGGQCQASSDCKSDFCIFTSGSIGMCTETCNEGSDCPGFDYDCVRLSDAPQKVCVPK